MPDVWLLLLEAFCVFAFAFSAFGLYWTRDKPRDWVPPAWYRAGYLLPVDRDRFRFNCIVGLVAFPLFAAGLWWFA